MNFDLAEVCGPGLIFGPAHGQVRVPVIVTGCAAFKGCSAQSAKGCPVFGSFGNSKRKFKSGVRNDRMFTFFAAVLKCQAARTDRYELSCGFGVFCKNFPLPESCPLLADGQCLSA